MTILEAAKLVESENPGRIAIGYWLKGEDVIINTKALGPLKHLTMSNQFVVTKDGRVYGTNPFVSDLDVNAMKKIK